MLTKIRNWFLMKFVYRDVVEKYGDNIQAAARFASGLKLKASSDEKGGFVRENIPFHPIGKCYSLKLRIITEDKNEAPHLLLTVWDAFFPTFSVSSVVPLVEVKSEVEIGEQLARMITHLAHQQNSCNPPVTLH